MKHIVNKQSKIHEQITELSDYYKLNKELTKYIQEIAHNAYLKGYKTSQLKVTPSKLINNI